MDDKFLYLTQKLEDLSLQDLDIIPWASPVISFGDINTSIIATLGINPSNREFVDINGKELKGDNRRFHTLNSLGLKNWKDIGKEHMSILYETCINYFYGNPYNTWFKKLDYLLSSSEISYYFPFKNACHLDLIPYATENKWSDLSNQIKTQLLKLNSDFLGFLLKDSKINLILLNGQTVVDNICKISEISFKKEAQKDWDLKRNNSDNIKGFSYVGTIEKIGEVNLGRKIKVLGYNHNIQSSFGITNAVLTSIRNWITKMIANET